MPYTGYGLKRLLELNQEMSLTEIAEHLTSLGRPVTRQAISQRFKLAGYEPTRHPRVKPKTVARLRKAGKKWREIAEDTGLGFSTVWAKLRQHGDDRLRGRFKYKPPNEAKTFAKLRVGGGSMTEKELANELGVSVYKVMRWVKRYKEKHGNHDAGTI